MAALVWKGDLLVNNFLLYFTTDLFNELISKRLTKFNTFHHILMIIIMLISKLTTMNIYKLIDLSAIFELSSILLALFYMGYISKPIYNLVFSYSFISVRLIYYNYAMYQLYLEDTSLFNNITISFYILLNIMNCGIVLQMRLIQKVFAFRPAIDCLLNKQSKTD